jgi:ribosome-associated protein
MPDDLRVNGWLVIPGAELHERFSRSSGPGGQSVNTADSRVELSYDVEQSAVLPGWARARITERLGGRLAGGVLTVAASEQRSQLANRQGARARLAALLRDAVAPPQRPRVPTRPSRGANERRLEAKRNRAAVKRARRRDRTDPELRRAKPGYSDGTLTTIASWVDLAITTTASVSGEGFSSRCGTCGGTHT